MKQPIVNLYNALFGTDAESSAVEKCALNVSAFELEARILYSASPIEFADAAIESVEVTDFAEFAVETSGEQLVGSMSAEYEILLSTAGNASDSGDTWDLGEVEPIDLPDFTTESLIFVDSGVQEFESMLADIQANYGHSANVQVIMLQDGNGIQQITDALSSYRELQSVHIVSHGTDGSIQLGDTELNNANLAVHAGEIASWATALSTDADILFYGCNLAATESGRELVDSFAELTDADVAASDDLTGHETLGGNWDFEYVFGELESSVFVSDSFQREWAYVLPVDVVNGDTSIWFTSLGSANDDAGLIWDDTDIVQIGNPGLQLEPDNALSDGTIEPTGFVAPVNVRGFHLVHAPSIDVGDATLLQGDLLIALDATHIFTEGFTAGRKDIVLFRPNAVNDYTSGTYYMFLEDGIQRGVTSYNIHGISVVEKDMTIGGTAFEKGDLVVAHSGGIGMHENLYKVHVNGSTFGSGGSTNTNDTEDFIFGTGGASSNLDFGGSQIQGIEVLEETIVMGGTTVAQGSVLLTLNTPGTQDVDDTGGVLNIQGEDIFYITVAASGAGPTDATATLLFEGLDVGLNSGTDEENLNGLSLINSLEFVSTVTVDTAEDYETVDARYGDTSSVSALLLDRGSDNLISLREALDASNNTTNGVTPDRILFDIADGTGGQYYYGNDLTSGSVSLANITTVPVAGEAAIIDFDPDHPYSWFSIDLAPVAAQLLITDSVIIDGYSQWGASENTLAVGNDAIMRIEVTNSSADGNRGFTIENGADGTTIQGLTINDFGASGILIDPGADDNVFRGNFIGTDVTGTLGRGNGEGIHIRSSGNLVGGSNPGDRNVISDNISRGVITYSFGSIETGNVVRNNYIGVDSSGLAGLGNGDTSGVQVFNQSGMRIIDNVISANSGDGIWFRDTDNFNVTIQGNMIGVSADGSNIIGNGGNGIYMATNSSGDTVNNTLIGGILPGQGNVIGGNVGDGIHIDGFDSASFTNTMIVGNFIGTNSSLLAGLANGLSGIHITGATTGVSIGGTGNGQANVIANNNLNGVTVASGTGNTIRGNRFENNGELGINLVGGLETIDGVTANDAVDTDGGANNLQNYPTISSVVADGPNVTINATINSNVSTNSIVVDFYWSPSQDGTLHGEAVNYIGSATVNTDSFGNAIIVGQTFSPTVPVPLGGFVTATATDPGGSTSEFALNVIAVAPNTAPNIITNQLTIDEGQTLVLDSADLNAGDLESAPATLQFTVSAVTGGHFALSIDTVTAIFSFTKAQLDAGDIVFVDNGDEFAPSYQVTVTDSGGLTDGPQAANITFSNVNDAPVLDNSGNLILTMVFKDDFANSGNTVAEFLLSNGGDRITDADGDPEGIAITSFDDTNGTWEFSLDGVVWSSFANVLPAVNANNALVLSSTAQIRFVPDAAYVGNAGLITFQAWDGSDGSSNGSGGHDAAINGGQNAFSVDAETATLDVVESLIAYTDNYTINEDQTLVTTGAGVLGNDEVHVHNIVGGALLNYQGNFAGSNPATAWEDLTNQPGFDLVQSGTSFGATTGEETVGIMSAYTFTGGDIATSTTSLDSLGSDVTTGDATMEFWFRPTDDTGKEIIFETGSDSVTERGFVLRMRNQNLQVVAHNGSFFTTVGTNISAEIGTGNFVQAAVTLEFIDADFDTFVDDLSIQLYVNGTLRNSTVLNNSTDWSMGAGETFAFGNKDGTAFLPDGGNGGFEGEIGAFRVYDSMLSSTDIQQNYDAVTALTVVPPTDTVTANGIAISVNADGTFTYDPGTMYNSLAVGESAFDSFTYTVQDGFGNTDSATVNITIDGVNDDPNIGPVITADSNEDAAGFNVNLLAGSSDDDTSDSLSIINLSVSGDTSGMTVNSTSIDVDPSAYNFLAAGESRVITYSFDIDDGNGGTLPQTATITITGVNDDPNIGPVITANSNEDAAGFNVNLLAGSSDDDTSDSLSIINLSVSGDTRGMTVNPTSIDVDPNAYSFLAAGESRVITYSYDIDDGNGGTLPQTATITITGVNDDPNIGPVITANSNEDAAGFNVNLLAGSSDDDTSDSLSIINLSVSGDTRGMTVNSTSIDVDPSAYNFLAAGESRVITYSYDIDDGNGGPLPQTATITITGVNDDPNVSAAIDLTFNEDVSPQIIDLLQGATDDDLSDSLATNSLMLVSGSDRGITYGVDQLTLDPNAYTDLAPGQSEILQYSYQIDDGNGGVIVQTATITITGLNDAPTAGNDSNVTVEDNPVTTNVLANDIEFDNGQVLTVSIPVAGQPANGTAVVNVDNTITYTPNTNFVGNDLITYEVNDGNGGTATATLAINVAETNDPPTVINPIVAVTVDEDAADTVIDLTTVFNDADDPILSYSLVNNNNTSLVDVQFSGIDLVLEYQPNQFGDATIEIRAVDGSGQQITDTFTVRVNPVNDIPVVINPAGPWNSLEDSSNTVIDLTNIFYDVEDPTLSYVISNDNVTLADASIVGNNLVLDYLPNASGIANILVEAIDSEGASTTHTIVANVAAVNDAPTVADQTFSTSRTESIVGNALAGAGDIDSGSLTVSLVTPPSSGTLTLNTDGSFVFVPDPDFVGQASFEFVALDGVDFSNRGKVVIEIGAPFIDVKIDEIPAVIDNTVVDDKNDDLLIDPNLIARPDTIAGGVNEVANKARPFIETNSASLESLESDGSFSAVGFYRNVELNDQLLAAYSEPGIPEEEATRISREAAGLEMADLWGSLDDLDNEIRQQSLLPKIAAGSVASIATVFTAGYLAWLIRGGQILLGLLSQLPAWSSLDMLAVLSRPEDELEDGDSSSLESIVSDTEADQRPNENENTKVASSQLQRIK